MPATISQLIMSIASTCDQKSAEKFPHLPDLELLVRQGVGEEVGIRVGMSVGIGVSVMVDVGVEGG